MPTTGIMTFAQRIAISPLDANNNPTLGTFNLQITDTDMEANMSDVDMTNSESNGFAEWAPTIVIPAMTLSGIVDVGGGWDAILLTCIQNKTFAQVWLYMAKPNGANNPVIYKSTQLFQKGKMMGKCSSGGELWRYQTSTKGIGRYTKVGVDYTGALVTGIVQT